MSIQIVYTKVGRLEWDSSKSRSNYLKHKCQFIDCQELFAGSITESVDERRDYGETRYIAIGAVEATTLVAVYTLRNGARRIISLRRANRNERKAYFKRET